MQGVESEILLRMMMTSKTLLALESRSDGGCILEQSEKFLAPFFLVSTHTLQQWPCHKLDFPPSANNQ